MYFDSQVRFCSREQILELFSNRKVTYKHTLSLLSLYKASRFQMIKPERNKISMKNDFAFLVLKE